MAGCVEWSQQVRQEKDLFIELAVIRLAPGTGRAAGLAVDQDRSDDELQLIGRIGVGSEYCRHTLDVGNARVGGYQMLDQLFADEWRGVGMEGEVIDGHAQLCLRRSSRWNLEPLQQRFCAAVMTDFAL